MLKQIQKVFVTNPTGVIGAHTVNSFIRAGYQVHCLLKQPTHTRDALLETRFNDTRLQPFMIPPDAQPGTVDHDTACDKALDGNFASPFFLLQKQLHIEGVANRAIMFSSNQASTPLSTQAPAPSRN